MDAEMKAKWLEALRSGKYPQTSGLLRRDKEMNTDLEGVRPKGFCCLGVLCEVSDFAKWDGTQYVTSDQREIAYLPRSVREAARMDWEPVKKLAEMNDEGRPFAEIADWIEANL